MCVYSHMYVYFYYINEIRDKIFYHSSANRQVHSKNP